MKLVAWNLDATEQAALFQTLRFNYFKWDVDACGKRLILPESIMLTRQEHAQAVAISNRFARVLNTLESALLVRPDLMDRLGIPPTVRPLVLREQSTELQLARYDLFLTPGGQWMVSEFNEDVPGGFNEAVGLPDLLGNDINGGTFAGDLRKAVVEALAPYDHVAFLYATGYSEDLQHMLIVQQWLEKNGQRTCLASPAHLRYGWRGARVLGQKMDAAFRFYPGEWFAWLDNRQDWERALPGFPMMNPLRRLLRQSKRLYTLWRDPALLPPEDIQFIESHTPCSLPYDPDLARAQSKADWVLKHAFGRMGDAVIMGNLVTEQDWQRHLLAADREPHAWLLQRRFEVMPLRNQTSMLYPTIGTYMVNNRFAGYYSRVDHTPFINHEAYHVTTLVEMD